MPTNGSSIAAPKYLKFMVGPAEYAIEVMRIQEILACDTFTQVPGAPPAVRGVINLRGNVVPVIDLSIRFGGASTEITKISCVVIVELESQGEKVVRGLLADSVSRVTEIHADEIRKAPDFGTVVSAGCLRGMTPGSHDGTFVTILNIDGVFGSELLRAAAPESEIEPAA
jgi:purine-binding chemotaxis protein CheW